MYDFINNISQILPGYILVFLRISGMVTTFPIFSSTIISNRVRIALVLVLTMTVTPAIVNDVPQFTSIGMLVIAGMRETMIGMIIGFGSRVLFEGFSFAGILASRQMGLMLANVMDPSSTEQIPLISQFWVLVITTFFLLSNSHHIFIETMVNNFRLIPLAGGQFPPALGKNIIMTGSLMFQIGVKYAAPAMLLLLAVDTAIALTARVMPQMNIFIVSLPLKIGVGIFALIASLNIFQILFDTLYSDVVRYISVSMKLIGGS